MSDGNDDDLEVYVFQGNDGELVPASVEKLVINQNVRILPIKLCFRHSRLMQVTLSYGLIRIDTDAFGLCENLREIKIPSTVQHIGTDAFYGCKRLTKVGFEISTASAHHQLQTIIYKRAFSNCPSLQRIKLPSSVTSVGDAAFNLCNYLMEANLATTNVTEVSAFTFESCCALQTVSLPNTLERIGNYAFSRCMELVTVVIPPDSQPIRIGYLSFAHCRQLANLVIPKDSTAKEDSFNYCGLLHERYSSSRIVAGLIGRFDGYPIHRMCYGHATIAVQELQECITMGHQREEEFSLVDNFLMTPLHVLFSTSEPSVEMLQVLLDQKNCQELLNWKEDANGKRPVDYLINNWNDATTSCLELTLQSWMIDPLASWGAMLWVEEMKTKVQAVLSEANNDQRMTLLNEAHSAFVHYERLECTSILELGLWKGKLKSGWSHDGSKRQALDRGECRCVCGADVVIPNVTPFLLA